MFLSKAVRGLKRAAFGAVLLSVLWGPSAVAAQGEGDYLSPEVLPLSDTVTGTAEFNGQEYPFAEAWGKAVSAGKGTVRLLSDVSAPVSGFGTDGGFLNGALYIAKNKNIILDLDGHTLDRNAGEVSSHGRAVQVAKGGTFTLKDSSGGGMLTGGNQRGNGGGVYTAGKFTLESGEVSGNSASRGGGIYVSETAFFSMTGGSVTGNMAVASDSDGTGRGGGIYAVSDVSLSGTVHIDGNEAEMYAPNLGLSFRDVWTGAEVRVKGSLSGSSIGIAPAWEIPLDKGCAGTFAGGSGYTLAQEDADAFRYDCSGERVSMAFLSNTLVDVRLSSSDWESGLSAYHNTANGVSEIQGDFASMWGILSRADANYGMSVRKDVTAFLRYPGDAATSWGYGRGIDAGHRLVCDGNVEFMLRNGSVLDRNMGAVKNPRATDGGVGFLVMKRNRYACLSLVGVTSEGKETGSVTGCFGNTAGAFKVLPGADMRFYYYGNRVVGNQSVSGGAGVDNGGYVYLEYAGAVIRDNSWVDGDASNLYSHVGGTVVCNGWRGGMDIGLSVEKVSQRLSAVDIRAGYGDIPDTVFFSDNPSLMAVKDGETSKVVLREPADCKYSFDPDGDSGNAAEEDIFYGSFDACWEKVLARPDTGDGTSIVTLLTDAKTAAGKKVPAAADVWINLSGHALKLTGSSGAGFTVDAGSGSWKGLEFIETRKASQKDTDIGEIEAGRQGTYDHASKVFTYYTSRVWNERPVSTEHVRDFSGVGSLEASGLDSLVELKSGWLTLSGGLYVNKDGGPAVNASATSGTTFVMRGDASIMGCGGKSSWKNGGGVCVMGGTIDINGARIGGCKGVTRGGGLYLNGSVSGTVLNSTISGCSAVNGGAVYYNSVSGKIPMHDCIFAGNMSSANGGAIYGFNCKMDVFANMDRIFSISHNVSHNGGGIYTYGSTSDVHLYGDDVQFNQNKAVNGGAMAVGWEMSQAGKISVNPNVSMSFNEASDYGGAVVIGGNTTKAACDAAIACRNGLGNAAAYGGFLYMNTPSTVSMWRDGYNWNPANHALDLRGNHASVKGGGILVAGGNLKVRNNLTLKDNTSGELEVQDNLRLASGSLAIVDGALSQDSYCGITPDGGYPAAGSVLKVGEGAASLLANGQYSFHPDDTAYECRLDGDTSLVIGRKESMDVEVGPDVEFSGILVQHYSYVRRIQDKTDGAEGSRIALLDTSGNGDGTGGHLPKNGASYQSKFMYIDPDTGEVAFTDELLEMWAERDLGTDELGREADMQASGNGTDYVPAEVWVKKPGAKQKSLDRKDWDIYAYDGDTRLTSEEGLSGLDGYVYVKQGDVVRFVYQSGVSLGKMGADFYDYDISDGLYYLSVSDAWNQRNGKDTAGAQVDLDKGKTLYMNTIRQGIHVPENYGEVPDGWGMLAFGNGNSGTTLGDQKASDGRNINIVNRDGSYALCAFGLVPELFPEGGSLKASEGLVMPDLFGEAEVPGKTLYPGHTLEFQKEGSSWLFSGVTGIDFGNSLTRFNHPNNGVQTWASLWTNNFWPMDTLSADFSSGHDLRFGAATGPSANKVQFVMSSGKSQVMPVSDDGLVHNSYFGMSTEFTFTVDEDYVGPLEYWFLGDDDMWVYLDGKLVCDIGGVHTRAGQYVNFWDYIKKGEGGEHKIQLFYTERGASGSVCWMQFVLPQVRSEEVDAPVPALPETGGSGIFWPCVLGFCLLFICAAYASEMKRHG